MPDTREHATAAAAGTFDIGGELTVNRMGFGAMRLTGPGVWGEPRDPDECRRVLRRAVELDVDFIDTADSYGPHVSERLIAEALYPYPDGLVIAKPACPHGSPEIYVAPVAFSDNGAGLPLIGVQTWAADNGSSWTAHLVVITQNADGSGTLRIRPSATYGQLIALAKCT